MTILVTGGAGFIGSNFLNYMLNKYPDYKFVCLDKLTYAGNLNNLKDIVENPNFEFYKADVCDRKAVELIFDKARPDMVVNFAAESHVDRSITTPEIFIKTNVLGVQILLDASQKYGCHFHQISTDEVYGEADEKTFANETGAVHPSSPYSASKAAADLLVLSYARTYGAKVTISRSSNNYGARQYPEKLIPLVIKNALNNKPIPVYGTGRNVRNWLYVDDHCNAIDLIIHKGKEGEIYNVCSDEEFQNVEVVKAVCGLLGKPDSLINYVTDRKGHDSRYGINSDKLRKLGWLPQTKFADGIKKTVEWYLNNNQL